MSQHSSVSNQVVNLWYTRCGAATASALAIRQQWLQEEFAGNGTQLHSLRDSESLEVRNSHFHHKQSGMFREGGNIPPIWAKGQGHDTVVVGITWLDEYQGIIVREDSGIHSITDLKGKRVGIPNHKDAVIDFQRGAAQHGFATAFELHGLVTADAKWVDIAAPSYDLTDGPRRERSEYKHVELEALNEGRVDAIFVRFARGVRLANTPGYRQLININEHHDPFVRVNNGTPRPVTVDRAFLQKHPDVVDRYLAVLLRTAAWAATHPQEVVHLLAPEGQSASEAEVIASHGANVHLSFTPTLSNQYVKGLEIQKNFLRDWGYVKQDFDIQEWIDPAPLARAAQLVRRQPEFTVFAAAQAA